MARRRKFSGANLIGKPISLTVRSPAILDAVAGVTATGFPAHAEFERQVPFERRFDAFVAPVALSASPGSGVAAPLVLIMLKDLTREQQLERMRADFVANASHELRTPLASLLGFIETLQGPARERRGGAQEVPGHDAFPGRAHEAADRRSVVAEPHRVERPSPADRDRRPDLGDTSGQRTARRHGPASRSRRSISMSLPVSR